MRGGKAKFGTGTRYKRAPSGEIQLPSVPVLHGNSAFFQAPYVQSFAGSDLSGGDPSDAVFTRLPFHYLDPTAISEHLQESTVARIFPNPGSSDFTLEWSAEQHSDVELTLYDINGRSVKRQNLQQSHGSNRASNLGSHITFVREGINKVPEKEKEKAKKFKDYG